MWTFVKKKKENNTNFLHQTDHLWMIPLSGFCLMAGEEDMVEKHFSSHYYNSQPDFPFNPMVTSI